MTEYFFGKSPRGSLITTSSRMVYVNQKGGIQFALLARQVQMVCGSFKQAEVIASLPNQCLSQIQVNFTAQFIARVS